MLSKIKSYGLMGLNGYPVQVEVDVSGGLPSYDTVGLSDASVRESKERVRAAIKNSGFEYPLGRITVNLAPADMRKEGSVYDLAIALGILAATEQVPKEQAERHMLLGELALDGSVRGIAGILPMVIGAYNEKIHSVILPHENAMEGSYFEGVEILPAASLRDVADFLNGRLELKPYPAHVWDSTQTVFSSDFADIKGQRGAKRAAEIAVAAGTTCCLSARQAAAKPCLRAAYLQFCPSSLLKKRWK